jgi:uncharacterized membrane protein YeaQ/YmgE (transglycosylase-associated protein family)
VFLLVSSHRLYFSIAAGALTGAIAGALAAKATKSGFFRGVSLGAIAGAILSVEVLEASRAYWCMEQTGSRGASSMVGDRYDLDLHLT